MPKHYLYVPELALNRIGMLKNDLPEKVRFEHLLYLIDRIVRIPIENRRINQDCNGWTPLCSALLQEIGIRYYRQNIDFLLDNGIIDSNESYQNSKHNKQCRRFRITTKYSSRLIKHPVCCQKFISKLEKSDRFWKRPPSPFKHLSIDIREAKKHINCTRLKPQQRLQAEMSIRLINDLKFNVFRDSFSRRLHSAITNLRSDLRPFLRWKDKRLVNVDIKNSQPLLATVIFNPNFYGSEAFFGLKSTFFSPIELSISDILRYNRKLSNSNTRSLPTLILEVLNKNDLSDLELFAQYCSSGNLYESINQKVFNSEFDRSCVKDNFFWLLFAENSKIDWKSKEDPVFKMFITEFPTIHTCFRLVKRKDHTLLARLLQSIESYLVLEKVAKKIKRERPELPIFTIHDSILTLEGEEEFVKHVFITEITRFIGLTPSIKIEHFN